MVLIYTAPETASHERVKGCSGLCRFFPPFALLVACYGWKLIWNGVSNVSFHLTKVSPSLIVPFRPQLQLSETSEIPSSAFGHHVQPGTATNWGESSVSKSLRVILCHVLFHFPFTPFLILVFPQSRVCICSASVKPKTRPFKIKLVCISYVWFYYPSLMLTLSGITQREARAKNATWPVGNITVKH